MMNAVFIVLACASTCVCIHCNSSRSVGKDMGYAFEGEIKVLPILWIKIEPNHDIRKRL